MPPYVLKHGQANRTKASKHALMVERKPTQ